jgi:hypothetical protein
MDESLKTIRTIQRIVMLISFAMVVLALSPNESNKYRDALSKLNAYMQIDKGGFHQYILNSVERFIDDSGCSAQLTKT